MRRRLRSWLTLLGGAVLVFVSWAVFPWLNRQVIRWQSSLFQHSYFSVREIKVSGGERIGGSEIVAMAGLSHGMNLWKIDSKTMEEKIARHPWVKGVLIRREFPHRVVIEVEERVVKAVAALDKLYYIDAEGLVFDQVREGDRVDYLFVTGLQHAELATEPDALQGRLREAFSVSDLMSRSLGQVSEIRFLSGDQLVLYPVDPPISLYMGWGQWPEKLSHLDQVLAEWKGREKHLAAVDLSFSQQVVVQLKAVNHG